jgi:hypothetical protein
VNAPACPPLGCAHSLNSFLDGVGAHIGDFLLHPHGMMNVASTHVHLAPVLVVPVLSCAAVPLGVWAGKRRRHLRLCLRGLVSVKVWKERWRWHCRIADVQINGHPAPKSMGGGPTRSGVTMLLKCVDGMNLALLEKNVPELAADLACMDVTFDRIHHNKGRVLVNIGRRDSLAESFPWPWFGRETTDFFGPIPAGVDTDGKPVFIDLREHCALVGGTTGGGKSWWLHTIVAAAMLDKRVRVHILDGKWGTGFAVWEHAATSFGTNDKDDLEAAYRIIVRLEERVDRIFNDLRREGKRSIDWATAKHIDLLILDEFTAFLGYKDIHKRLLNLIARGRAAGLIMLLSTQRPSSKIIDTDFRELFHYRVAFWSDRNGSKMILGDGVEADASEFSGMNPGEMWLLTEGRRPRRCRGYSLTDDMLRTLAARAGRLRRKDDAPQETVQPETRNVPVASEDDSPPTARSPKTNLTVVHAPTETVSVAPGAVVVPADAVPAVPKALRPTLVCIALHGPQTASGVIQTEMGIPASTQRYRCQQLERLGLVSCARQVQSGRGNGGRDPLLWSLTELGTAALTHKPEREKEDAR